MMGTPRELEQGSARGAPDEGILRGVGWIEAKAGLPRCTAELGLARLKSEFPHLPIALARAAPAASIVVSEANWCDVFADPSSWDAEMQRLAQNPGWIYVKAARRGHEAAETINQVLTRYQRLAPRANELSRTDEFARALGAHRQLHDLSKPLVRADYDHALDVWQWVLRLSPNASLPLQLAALFHDIERLVTEADQRVEHRVPSYQLFKDAHARAGAQMAAATLLGCGLDDAVVAEVRHLVERHEVPSAGSPSAASIIGDADALSFFSLNSPGFADYYGSAHTQMKVRYSLRRLSARARRRLPFIKLRTDVARYLAEAMCAERSACAEGALQ